MANVLNALLRNSALCPIKYAIKPSTFLSLLQTQARTLYSGSSLGLDGYEQQRERTKSQLANIIDKFKTKMQDYTQEESRNMIFTEDLKNMIHIAETDDIQLVVKMMNRFNEQNKQLRFGSFVFGPVVMRMMYHLNKPVEALECFKSEKLQGFFDQLISYQLLLDLLYENKMYDEVLKTFNLIQERQIEGTQYPKNIVVLAMAACYKLNTPESLKFALNLWGHLNDVGHLPMRRATTFCAGLALNQGQPDATLEIVSSAKNQNYTTVRNLKIAALTAIGRLEDIIPLLKNVLNQEGEVKHTFNMDVLEKVKEAVEKNGSVEIQQEFKKISEYLKENGHISETTLDHQLCSEITTPAFKSQQGQFGKFQRSNQDNRRNFQNRSVGYRRPGLSDMQ